MDCVGGYTVLRRMLVTLQMKEQKKEIIIKCIGYGIVIASIIYIIVFLRNVDYSRLQGSFKKFYLIKGSIFIIICACSNLFLVFAWKFALELFHQKHLPFNAISNIYLKTFIARYIPGNIFHFVGRQMLGNKLGISQTSLALSSILESFLLVVVGFVFIVTGFFQNYFPVFIPWKMEINSKAVLFILVVGCAFVLIYSIYYKRFREISNIFTIRKVGHLARLLMCYSLFLIINGVILFCIFSFLFESNLKIENVAMIICANVFAWLGGFITPGAPGGLGVREALLTMLLPDMLPKVVIIGGVAIFRIITLFGEVLALCVAICLFRSPSNRISQNK